MKRRTLASALAVTATLALPGAALATGQIRVLHASPDAPAVDVYVDGGKAVTSLDRGEITPYLALKRGWHRYAIRPAGSAPRSAAVLKGRFWVPNNRASTLAATGFLSDLQIRRIRDAVRRPFDAARIRVVHLSPDAPAVDIVADGVGTVIKGLKYPNASGYLVVPAGTYTFRVRAAGSPDDVLVVPGVELSAGENYSAWAVGSLAAAAGNLPLKVVATKDVLPARYARTKIRLLHAAPDAPAVDVYVNGSKVAHHFAFGKTAPANGGYLTLQTGKIKVAIRAAGAPASSAPVYSTTVTLPAQKAVTAAATGLLGGATPNFAVTALVDSLAPLAADKVQVAAAHLSPDTPAVDVFAGTDTKVITGLAFRQQSDQLTLPAGSYTLTAGVSPATAGTIPVVTNAALPAGSRTTIYAIGLLGGTPALQFLPVTMP